MTIDMRHAAPPRDLPVAVVSLVAVTAVAALGGFATSGAIPTWYAGLQKPAFNPPNAVFGPVWTLLYLLMAYAAWEVWRRSGGATRRRAMALYAAQLVLNLAWSLIFFGARRPDLALAEVAALFVAVVLTAVAFWRIHRPAGLVMVPYALWVSFAALLNFEVWRLN